MTPAKKTTRKAATKKAAGSGRENDAYDPVTVGNDDETESAGGVAVMRTPAGLGVLLPRSLRNLRGDAAECMAEVQKTAGVIHQAQRDLSQLVAEARSLGVSWGGIGWSVGTSAEAARQRWGTE